MRMGLVRAGAWTVATAAAVSVSWLGVHRVLADTSYQQPHMLAGVTAPTSATPTPLPTPPPLPSSTGPAASRPASPTTTTTTATTTTTTTTTTSSGPGAGGGDQIESFTRPGGRIVISMGPNSASLVSAIADQGWSVHTWVEKTWIRVDFDQGDQGSVFYVTWNGHPPMVQD
ncbi:hypothetical protein [Streptacidiphilus albus]|uniref:hypothetical protein n=1 Tax=Streptacidiphilus albus TaxID=105425 RepID=UPI00054C4EDA|nr:hypothetical protein [Streptacidiphilus albus]